MFTLMEGFRRESQTNPEQHHSGDTVLPHGHFGIGPGWPKLAARIMTAHNHLHNPEKLLTPAMHDVIRRMAKAKRPPFHTLTASQARAAYEAGAGVLEITKPELARVEDFTIAARDGFALPARLYAPSHEKLPALLFFHGGGFTVGSINTHDVLCRELSRLSGAAVISLDYRLAPEFRFPTAAEDAWDALQWLANHAGELGLDTSRLATGGDSAGGTLATVSALQARDAGLALRLQLLFYPGCSPHQNTASHRRFASGFVLNAEQMGWFFSQYLPAHADREDWRFAPLLAPDVEGVAPAWFGLAECDPLVDEGLMYADRLRASGVTVDLEIYRGVTHEFIKMGRIITQARLAHAAAAQALQQAFDLPANEVLP